MIKQEVKVEALEKNDDGVLYSFSVKLPMSLGWISNVKLIVGGHNYYCEHALDYVNNDGKEARFEKRVFLPTKAIYHYYFSCHINNQQVLLKKKDVTSKTSIMDEEKWKLSVNFETPKWAQGKIIYHIFVDRFNKGEGTELKEMPNRNIHKSWNEDVSVGPNEQGLWNVDYYGGNLKGIIEKLDYIKSLGTSIIYLSPICLSQSNHRYDTGDYEVVDPYIGSNEDLKELCSKAHAMGMNIILDAVFNHTGNDSKYFNEYGTYKNLGAYQSMDSHYSDFYRKNNHQFDYWWGMKNLPVCDGSSKKWQEYIYGQDGIIDKWFRLGIDGLRLDVADELSDEFIEGIRTAVHRNKKDGFILGEVWKNPMYMNRGYLSSGKGMDSVMDYLLVDALIRYYKYGDFYNLGYTLNQINSQYPKDTINSLMNFTSTHDISRAINIFGSQEFNMYGEWAWNLSNNDREWQRNYKLSPEEYRKGLEVYKSYLFALTFLPGNLSIFYGDEVGLEGMGNLANRRPFPWDNINYDLLKYFQYIGKIRNTNQFLENADLNIVDITACNFMFERESEEESSLILVNRTNIDLPIHLPKGYEKSAITHSLNNSNKTELSSYGGLVLKKEKK